MGFARSDVSCMFENGHYDSLLDGAKEKTVQNDGKRGKMVDYIGWSIGCLQWPTLVLVFYERITIFEKDLSQLFQSIKGDYSHSG